MDGYRSLYTNKSVRPRSCNVVWEDLQVTVISHPVRYRYKNRQTNDTKRIQRHFLRGSPCYRHNADEFLRQSLELPNTPGAWRHRGNRKARENLTAIRKNLNQCRSSKWTIISLVQFLSLGIDVVLNDIMDKKPLPSSQFRNPRKTDWTVYDFFLPTIFSLLLLSAALVRKVSTTDNTKLATPLFLTFVDFDYVNIG